MFSPFFVKQNIFSSYQKFCKRFTKETIRYENYVLSVPDVPSVLWQIDENFIKEHLRFQTTHPTPTIIDCGANVGVTCLYFKKLYPHAKIQAFEADPNIYSYLCENLAKNGIHDVTTHNKAVWTHDGTITFGQEGADGGSILLASDKKVEVEAVSLKKILSAEAEIDFLKIDIEGAETEVLLDCGKEITKVSNLFVEYHSFKNATQTLDKLLHLLTTNGFHYYLSPVSNQKHPFLKLDEAGTFDLQVNIYATQEKKKGHAKSK